MTRGRFVEPSIADKRSLLFSARMQLSPQVQPLRQAAIDQIVLQSFFIHETTEGLSLDEFRERQLLCFSDGSQIITPYDLQKSIERLIKSGKINKQLAKSIRFKKQRFSLSKSARQEIGDQLATASRLVVDVSRKLFKNVDHNIDQCSGLLVDILSRIFSALGESYARTIKGDISSESIITSPIIDSSIRSVLRDLEDLDLDQFRAAVFRFFEESDPQFDLLKWNLCQNFYISKSLGLDRSGRLLSSEIFQNALFYLDTNILIHGLDEVAPNRNRFDVLLNACKNLGIKLAIVHVTLQEMERVVHHYEPLIERVSDKIPPETAAKIGNIFFDILRRKRQTSADILPHEVFESFYSAREKLENLNISIVDDPWFPSSESDRNIQQIARELKAEYFRKRRRSKSDASALHDAQLLSWVIKERQEEGRDIWLVTFDTSLPQFEERVKGKPGRPVAVTLDAVLQWLSPAVRSVDMDEEFSSTFSEAVKIQLLPQANMFDVRDFIMFADLGWQTKELPAEDVEGCIRHIKATAPELDPADPSDREKLSHEINRFFADPGRKYLTEIDRLEAENQGLIDSFGDRERSLMREIRKIRAENDKNRRLAEAVNHRRRGQIKLSVVGFSVAILEIFLANLLIKFGEGSTWYLKIWSGWEVICGLASLGVLSLCFVLNEHERRHLGRPIRRLFKLDDA